MSFVLKAMRNHYAHCLYSTYQHHTCDVTIEEDVPCEVPEPFCGINWQMSLYIYDWISSVAMLSHAWLLGTISVIRRTKVNLSIFHFQDHDFLLKILKNPIGNVNLFFSNLMVYRITTLQLLLDRKTMRLVFNIDIGKFELSFIKKKI